MFISTPTKLVRLLILKSVALIYAIAFTSWYYQISDLYGPNGLLPLKQLKIDNIWKMPTLLYYSQNETTYSLICIVGTFLGIFTFISNKLVNTFTFLLLWILYLSIYTVGQDFAQFQWDIMILDVGFLAIIYTIFDVAGKELYKWLAFRLYFSSGILKFLSQCPTWWNLTALHFHFASQPIPHIISWWAHQLPSSIKRLMVAGNFFTLIAGSTFFYFPLRSVRIFGFLLQLFMQISIMLTGNYNFFNLLSIIVTFSVLDDDFIQQYFPKFILKKVNCLSSYTIKSKKDYVEIGLIIYFSAFLFLQFFPEDSIIGDRKLPFDVEDLANNLLSENVFYYSMMFIIFTFFYYLTSQGKMNAKNGQGLFRKILGQTLNIFVFLFIFSFSTFAFQNGLGIKQSQTILFDSQYFQDLYQNTYQYHIVNSYGLFRRMTGVNGRPELIFYGSNNGQDWKEYEFYYKPGDLTSISPIAIPHQPRLDWQLWFASFSNQIQDKYVIHLAYKLLNGQNIGIKNNPFPNKPPKYIQIEKQLFYFTSIEEMKKSGRFWKSQSAPQNEYLPPISLKDPQLQQLKIQLNFTNQEQEHIIQVNINQKKIIKVSPMDGLLFDIILILLYKKIISCSYHYLFTQIFIIYVQEYLEQQITFSFMNPL